jgi:hypothetical protein
MSVICSLLSRRLEKDPFLSGAGATHRVRNWPVTEIDHRSAKDPPPGIGAQSSPNIPVEERQAEFTFVLVHSAFAGARELPFAHQDQDAGRGYAQKMADECSVDQECVLTELNRVLNGSTSANLSAMSTGRRR